MATTILIALREGKRLPKPDWRYWTLFLVGIPALATTVSATLEQFKLNQIWELRVTGIYELNKLVPRFYVDGCDGTKLQEIADDLSILEKQQTSLDHLMDGAPHINHKQK